MWERFSYYGMRALLIYFLTQHFLFSDEKAYLIYGAYTAMVYLAPVIGGVIADRYLGPRKAVTLGAILLVLGHFGMAFEGAPALARETAAGVVIDRDPVFLNAFFFSLALIVTGVGFLKTNASTIVGALYEKGDPRRDSGFTYFYMGINIGGAAAPLLCGWLGQTYGWGYGFGLAGIGMLAGLIGFLRGQKHLEGHAEPPDPQALRAHIAPGISRETAIYIFAALLVVAIWFVLQHQAVVGQILSISGIVTSAFILYFAFWRCDREERDKLLVCAVLLAFTIGFWAFYEQMGSSLNLFADRVVNRVVFGYEIPASMFQSLPAIFVILLAPIFSILWIWLAKRGWEPTTPVKFSLGIAFLALAFFILVFGSTLASGGAKVALIWFVLNFFFLVVGELCLSPVGLSMVTKLSPKRLVGMMMGMFFLAYSASSFIAGKIAQLTSAPPGEDVIDIEAATIIFASVYGQLGLIALGVAAFLYLISPILGRAMHEEGNGNPTLIARLYPKRFRQQYSAAAE